jgi:hypothetical protein
MCLVGSKEFWAGGMQGCDSDVFCTRRIVTCVKPTWHAYQVDRSSNAVIVTQLHLHQAQHQQKVWNLMSFSISGLRRAAYLLVPAPLPKSRLYSLNVNSRSESVANIEVNHSKFLSEASSAVKWEHGNSRNGNNSLRHTTANHYDAENVAQGKGMIRISLYSQVSDEIDTRQALANFFPSIQAYSTSRIRLINKSAQRHQTATSCSTNSIPSSPITTTLARQPTHHRLSRTRYYHSHNLLPKHLSQSQSPSIPVGPLYRCRRFHKRCCTRSQILYLYQL